jgi:hypothetical protein
MLVHELLDHASALRDGWRLDAGQTVWWAA